MQNKKLRIGLLVDSTVVPAWQYQMVDVIQRSDYAEILLVVQAMSSGSRGQKTRKNGLALKLLKGVERLLLGRRGQLPNACEPKDLSAVIGGEAHVVDIQRATEVSPQIIAPESLSRIKFYEIDVFVKLGAVEFHDTILDCARYGIWRYCHGEGVMHGEYPGYWEVMNSSPITETTLSVIARNIPREYVLYRSSSSTDVMSFVDNANRCLWKSLQFAPRKLKELFDLGGERFFAKLREENTHPEFYDRRFDVTPNVSELGVLLTAKLMQRLQRKISNLFYFNQWLILFDLGDELSTVLWRFKLILPPKDRKWADPFVVSRNDKYYIFIEEFLRVTQKGHISVIEMEKSGKWKAPQPVLETQFHLSYPFVFEFGNEMYMVPESVANRSVGLYKCIEFPNRWAFQKNLIDGRRFIDSTLYEWDGCWWLFANQVEVEGASPWDELYLYFSDNPLSSEWTPHPQNPIVSDVTTARPAGKLFLREGRLYRPSQNSAGHYGFGFNVSEVLTLSKTEYRERVVSRVEPNWNKDMVSTHTLNYEDGLTVVDGQLRRRRFL